MLRAWTELLPVFLFRRLARRCGCVEAEGCAWHDARPGILIRDDKSWRAHRVSIVEDMVRRKGIKAAESQWGHFGKDVLAEGIRAAFVEREGE